MQESNQYKLAPGLRRYVERESALETGGAKEPDADVIIEVASNTAMKKVKEQPWIKNFVQVVDGYLTATIESDGSRGRLAERIATLGDILGVIEIEAIRYIRPQLYNSVGNLHGWDPTSLPPGTADDEQGAGVVIGIVDYGIDYTLPAFQTQDGKIRKTRIAFLWDQQLKPEAGEASPPKYGYGVDYTHDQIDSDLAAAKPGTFVRHQPRQPEFPDIDGHGTAVAGVAAGKGPVIAAGSIDPPPGRYLGVAPGATLVFVHLARKTILQEIESPQGTLANSINLIHAIAYCFEQADKLGMPCVVNLSMGFNGGGHDGNMAVEWIIDALLQKSGRALVVSAGNENRADKQIYYCGMVQAGATTQVPWIHGYLQPLPNHVFIRRDDPTANELEIWYSRTRRLRVRLVTPDNTGPPEQSGWVAPGEFLPFTFSQGESVYIASDEHTPWTGDARIQMKLSPPASKGIRQGTWLVELEAIDGAPGALQPGVRIDGWIERSPLEESHTDQSRRSRFDDYKAGQAITVTTPGTAHNVLTVGSYDDKRGDQISPFSGRGRTRDGRKKPDIAAPGERIYTINAGAGTEVDVRVLPALVAMQGTSMSAPHITGIVARLLGRQHYLTSSEIRDLLIKTAVLPAGAAGPWDPQWGFGKPDAAAAMQRLNDMLR